MSDQDHIVRRQVYELTLVSGDGAYDIQERLGRIHHEEVAPLLAGVISSIGTGDDVWLIDCLDLDLGTLSAARLEEQLAPRIEARFAEMLAQTVPDARCLEGDDSQHRQIPAERAGIELLRSFLTTGTLPWWAPVGARGPVDSLLLDALENAADALVDMMRALDHARIARRIVKQFPETTVHRLVALLAGPSTAALQQVSSDWKSCLAEVQPEAPWPEPPHATVATETIIVLLGRRCEPAAVSERIIRRVSHEQQIEIDELIGLLARVARRRLASDRPLRRWLCQDVGVVLDEDAQHARDDVQAAGWYAEPADVDALSASDGVREGDKAGDDETGARRPDPEQLADRDHRISKTGPGPTETRLGKIHVGVASRTDAASGTDGERPMARAPHATDQVPAVDVPVWSDEPRGDGALEPAIDREVGALVDNAGLVIAWPFLPRFFEQLELVHEKSFVSGRGQERALLLLQYLVTGESEIPEHQLVLNKLLCGWPLEEPVAGRVEITPREEQEISELCASILEHWTALGSTSAAGLRTSFLAREGLLKRQELGWNLTIERTGYDVLLDQLPWGIGFVMLPWMDDPLVVEW